MNVSSRANRGTATATTRRPAAAPGEALVRTLGAALSETTLDGLRPDVVRRAREVLLDTVGAMLVGAAYGRSARSARDMVAALSDGGRSTVVGAAMKAAAPSAALCNGVAAHALDLDDSHRLAAGYHPGATVVPAVLAVAEQEGADVPRVLEAIVCGYEAGGRIGRAVNPSHRYRGFHSTGTVGVFGAAAGSARVLGLDATQTAMALSVAASMAGGIFAFLDGLHPTKHLHAGHAAQAGVQAALLVRHGFTGPDHVLEGPEGFFRAYADEARPELVTAGLHERTEILSNYFKPYAACGHAFTGIEASLQLRERGVRTDDVTSIEVATYRAAAVLHRRSPGTFQEAQFSLPFLVALSLAEGEVSIASVRAGLGDQDLRDLASRCAVDEDRSMTEAFPGLRPTRVTVTLRDGSEVSEEADHARGMPERPLSTEQVVGKFLELTGPVLRDGAAARVVDAAMGDDGTVRDLVDHQVNTHEVIA